MQAASWCWSAARSSRWSAAGSPTATSRSSTRSPRPCAGWSRKSGTRTRNVAMALPPSAVITKKIILPGGMSEQELEIQVESEANQYIPFSLDEVSLDFCVIGPSANSAGDVEVLIAASRKEKVQDRQGLAEAAGLKAMILDVESYASRLAAGAPDRAACPTRAGTPMVALFEVGASTTSMQVHAQRGGAVRPRPGLRRRPAHPADRAPVRLFAGRGRDQEAQRRPAGRLRRRACSSPSWTAWRRKSPARCSSSSPARRTTASTTCMLAGGSAALPGPDRVP